jgi:aminoglycoside N3'-acetyltransferase
MAQPSISEQDIVDGLRQLGVQPGAIVEVHSSLSAFGQVAGGATAVIAALIDVVTPDGTIVMSAYPVSPAVPLDEEDRARGITWKVRKLALDSSEPTGIGRVADTFRQRHDVVCGSEFFRTCAWGRDAEWHCHGYHGLLAVDGWCLLMGVGVDSCSSLHAAEDIRLPADIAAYWTIPESVQRAYDPQVWNIGYGETPDNAWQKVWDAADRQGLIRHTQIGQAACHYLKARSLVTIYRRWRQSDPYGLFGVPRPRGAS